VEGTERANALISSAILIIFIVAQPFDSTYGDNNLVENEHHHITRGAFTSSF
jgi:hypothetical protein